MHCDIKHVHLSFKRAVTNYNHMGPLDTHQQTFTLSHFPTYLLSSIFPIETTENCSLALESTLIVGNQKVAKAAQIIKLRALDLL